MDLRDRLTDFLITYPQFSKKFDSLAGKKTWSCTESAHVTSVLSELLISKDGLAPVSERFGPLLLNLLHRAAVDVGCEKTFSLEKHENLGVCLAKLCATYPFALRFALEYFQTHPSLFHRFSQQANGADGNRNPKKRRNKRLKVIAGNLLSDVDVVKAVFEFLSLLDGEFRDIWDWNPIVNLVEHTYDDVKWFACLCCCTLFHLSASQAASFLRIHFKDNEIRELSVRYDKDNVLKNSAVQQLLSLKDTVLDLSDNVANVCGILLPCFHKEKRLDGPMVPVPSTCANLYSLALAVKRGLPVLLQGPIGCGKTAIVEHIAAVTGRSEQPLLLKVQLGDQTDSKMLIGTYQCTEVPGEFVWRPGALLTAIEKGYWILLEDIDYAPMDVISMLIPLLETGSLAAPGLGRKISAGPGFQLFATRRLLGGSNRFHANQMHCGAILDKLFTKISLEPLSISELSQLIRTKWPILSSVVARLLEIYLLTCSAEHEMDDTTIKLTENIMPTDARSISTRDLLKWCHRVAENFSSSFETSAILTFQDAFDCFCGSITRTDAKIVVAEAIAARLNITKAKAEYFCTKHKPNIKCGVSSLTVGRSTLPRLLDDSVMVRRSRSTFAFTRQASVLLEQIAVAVRNHESVLLVGETGTGKTATVQYLAEETRRKLVVVNMNQHSDSADLLGGFKPVDLKLIVRPLKEEYEQIFCQTFSRAQNGTFLNHVTNCFTRRQWSDLFQLMLHTQLSAVKRLENAKEPTVTNGDLVRRWQTVGEKIEILQSQVKHSESALAFTFVEGSLVRALREGHWILLDEVNLASAETLHCLGGLLESPLGSVLLLERGDVKTVKRHPDFRLFACMNPATDVGKRELPLGIRNRFTEIYMEDLDDSADLSIVVQHYLRNLSVTAEQNDGIVKFYLQVRRDSSKTLTDGTGRKPHYSLRTLCRALSYAAENPCQSTPRSLYEAFCMSFLTQLDRSSHPLVKDLIVKHILAKQNVKSTLMRALPEPCGGNHVNFEGFWIPRGAKEIQISDAYILTASVRRNLLDLARVVAAGRHPVLLQGDTSVGKTSLVKWLASASGHQCVRVNNHEHTDLQEYVGSYAADDSGRLVFKEGVLVNAMRQGDWIVLDELNLAPTDVLEALNRVLDDNRELFITETQETVKAHPNFCLFATQNPPGHYGGRKVLSRAFRNRFVELHFEEIPSKELEIILHQRCAIPPSYCSKLVAVMTELQMRRSGSGIFAGKQGFITLRDLFRWAERYRLASMQITKFYDWDQHLADEGYLLLAGRVRNVAEELIILDILKKHFKKLVDPQRLFTADVKRASPTTSDIIQRMMCGDSEGLPEGFGHIVWTYSMRRLAVLLGQALRFDEPVLMVGDTGCGKTTLCQLFAALSKLKLRSVNCHMHSEGADFLGGLRPVRNRPSETDSEDNDRLFEWVDGPLVKAMKEGSVFLCDEISLADDSVLERLNSVLEPERTLLLAEKGGNSSTSADTNDDVEVVAKRSFRFLATMNPGGDFGKKELSPALRNRFTEIWCPNSNSRDDLLAIIEHNLVSGIGLCNKEDGTSGIGHAMLDFLDWFGQSSMGTRVVMSVRDILAWVHFINTCSTLEGKPLDVGAAYVHGASLVILDSLGSGIASHVTSENVSLCRDKCLRFLRGQLQSMTGRTYESLMINDGIGSYDVKSNGFKTVDDGERFGLNPFYIKTGANECHNLEGLFAMSASSTAVNALRVLRAMQLSKPILLEGSPGVGKTSLVLALAKASGHDFVRINLSEQTDISDLFGADLPVEGGRGGQFAWRDGPFLRALKLGHWVVLDELNLASQSVLEGLNACLDHRAEVYIPELGRTFGLPPGVKRRIFACQNPLHQGGARKGLPRSFLNRFTQVYVEPLSPSDLEFIATVMFPKIHPEIIATMVKFNQQIYLETVVQCSWGTSGGPWEVNLRDIFRWCEMMAKSYKNESNWNPSEFVGLIYADRMRTNRDKNKVYELWQELMPGSEANLCCSTLSITKSWIQLGHAMLSRTNESENPTYCKGLSSCSLSVLPTQLGPLRSLMKCIEMKWMAILVGPHACGKTALVTTLAQLTGSTLQILNMNSDMDTTELLGGFEQVNLKRHLAVCCEDAYRLAQSRIQHLLSTETDVTEVAKLTSLLHEYKQLLITGAAKTKEEAKQFLRKVEKLKEILNKISFSCDDVENSELLLSVRNKLNRLEAGVEAEGSLNCGGRFEWVDSALVNALQNGHWLLIDNVNFCSPSVLDRLNALLEPNGVLTISERGVIDGEIPTVVPHPNFRLILTMDPQSGEISRAMRNRGVEIFLHGEMVDLHFTDGELCTIFDDIGLSDIRVQHHLIRIHREMDLQLIGDALSLSDLLRAAQLTVQHIQEGCNILTSLHRSCSDVYVKCRHLKTKKNLAKSILDDVLRSVNFDENASAMVSCHEHLAVSKCRIFPELATVKQEMVVLNGLLQLVMSADETATNSAVKVWYFEKFDRDFSGLEDIRLESVFVTALIIYLQRASTYDWDLRLTRLNDILRSRTKESTANIKFRNILEKFLLFAVNVTKEVTFVFEQFVKTQFNESPQTKEVFFDPRWNSDLASLLSGSCRTVTSYSASANRFTLLLKDTILKVKSGKLSSCTTEFDEFTAFPKNHLVKFFDLIFFAIAKRLQDPNWQINDDLATECAGVIYRLHSAHSQCAVLLLKKRLTVDDQLQLRLLLREMFSSLFPLFFGANWERNKISDFPQMYAVYQKISSFLRKWSTDNVNQNARKLAPILGSQKPFRRPLEANIHCRLNRLWTPDFKSSSVVAVNDRLLNFYLSEDGFLFRRKIFRFLQKEAYEEEDRDTLKSLEREFKSAKSIPKSDSDCESPFKEITAVTPVAHIDQVLPIVEHLAVLQEQHSICLMTDLSKMCFGASLLSSALSSAIDLLSVSVSATPAHLVALHNFYNLIARNESVSSDFHLANVLDVRKQFYEFCSQSARVTSAICGVNDRLYSETFHQSPKPVDYLCRPQLSILIAKILSSRTKDKHDVYTSNLELGFCEQKFNQLDRLRDILWTNAACIGSRDYNPQLNDATLFWSNFCELGRAVCVANSALDLVAELEDAQQSNEFDILKSIMNRVLQRCAFLPDNVRSVWLDIDLHGDIGVSWLHIGWLRVALLLPIFEFDPAEEQKFQLRCYQEEISRLEEEIHVVDSQMFLTLGCTLSNCSPSFVHPLITFAFRRLNELKLFVTQLEDDMPYRPLPSQYEALRKEFQNYWTTVASKSLDSFKEWKIVSSHRNSEMAFKIRAWLGSQTAFLDRISTEYPLFRDLTHSCCLGILQMMHGAFQIMHKLEVAAFCDEAGIELSSFQLLAKDNLMFPYCPSVLTNHEGNLQHPSILISKNMLDDIQSGVISEDGRSVMQMFKSSLLELKNLAIVTGTNHFESGMFEMSVELFATLWHAQEERRLEKEAEDEKTFELRPREHGEIIDDEKQLEALVKKTFPTYREVFEDLVPSDTLSDSVNQMDETENLTDSEQSEELSKDDIHSIVVLYKEILTGYGHSRWFSSTSSDVQKPDVAAALLARYPVLAHLIRRYGSLLDNALDAESIGGHLLYVAHLQNVLGTDDQNRQRARYNFYNDSNVAEVKNAQPILRRFSLRINELLAEWPDHPTLKQLLKVIDRILNFSITSPVMKFITGFEMLLGQAQEWEKNAHKGVSLLHQLKEVTDQIILWRKLEIGCWSSCLNSIEDRTYDGTNRWWLHLYRSMQLPSNENLDDLSVLRNVLQTFMEKSSLGEFKGRLELMFSLARFFTKRTPFKREVLELVWNVYDYYRQYVPVVDKLILQLRKPIEKNLKEFIKIARWNDINFWAVKQSVDKSHRTLLKHMHHYEVALRQSMQAVFADQDLMSRSEKESVSNRKHLQVVPRVTAYFSAYTETDSTAADVIAALDSGDLSHLPRLIAKARKLCKKLIRNCAFDNKIAIVDEFVGDVIDCAHELQALEVNKSASKEKQISEAKNINLRKRKALADLFKQLSTIGLSYRKGLVGDPPDEKVLSLTPIDVDAALKELKKNQIVDDFLLRSWLDCPRYLQRSLARMALMRSSLQTPTKELGPANIHRCQGYVTQLLHLSIDQRNQLAPLLDALSDIRFVVDQFAVIRSDTSLRVPQVKLRTAVEDIKSMVRDAYLCLQQFRVLLEACPVQANGDSNLHTTVLKNGQQRMAISDCRRNDLGWTETVAATDECIDSLEHLRHIVFRDNPSSCINDEVHPWHNLSTIEGILFELETVLKRFPLPLDVASASVLQNPLTVSVFKWRESISASLKRTSASLTPYLEETSQQMEDIPGIVRALIKMVLKAIENLVKLNMNENDTTGSAVNGQENKENPLDEKGLLANALHRKLIESIDMLKSKVIRDKLMELYSAVATCATETSKEILESAERTVCLVEQYLGLTQYYLVSLVRTHRVTAKMSSVLLGIFVELIRKGFCVPAEYSNDVGGEQSTKFEDNVAGTGIGEGEGLKDVSDRIENEDQLEDAFQEGTEKKDSADEDANQKPDLEDEEHGIEMSDDFDGKVHDLEKEGADDEESEKENSEDEQDEEELEKQMGDLNGEDADKLDEKIWGDDDDEEEDEEDEEDDNGDLKEDEYGKGDGPQEEARMVAKDDNKERGEPNEDDDDGAEQSAKDEDDKKANVNMIDEREFDDKPSDLGDKNDEQMQEPDDMDLPEDLNLDKKEGVGEDEDDNGDEETMETEDVENGQDDDSSKEAALDETEASGDTQKDAAETDAPPETNEDGDTVENKDKDDGEVDGAKNEEIGLEHDDVEPDANRADPSRDKPTEENEVQESEVSAKECSADVVDAKAATTQESRSTKEQSTVNSTPDEDVAGVGLAEAETTEGHSSSRSSKLQQANRSSNQAPQRSLDKLGKSNEKRSLGSADESNHKRLRTEDADGNDEDDAQCENQEDEPTAEEKEKLTSDLYRHIPESEKHYDGQTLDAATESQASKQRQQPVPNREDEEGEALKDEDDVHMLEEDDAKDKNTYIAEKKPVFGERTLQANDEPVSHKDEGDRDDSTKDGDVVVDGEIIATSGAQRGPETSFHTRYDQVTSLEVRTRDVDELRRELEDQLQVWKESKTNDGSLSNLRADERISFSEAQDAWRKYEEVIDRLSRDLCEQLRLILEPSLTAKLKGDYRTGKRLNMRKVIPYVASQFRKDKIWLRRTKPSKREYQILLAMDDSSSMADNHSKQLAFEAMALICNSLALLEAGEIGVASFGETVRLLHPLGDPFSDRAGAELLRQFTFEQQKTRVGMMLDVALSTMLESRKRIRGLAGSRDVAQLLIIVSDGRGLFNEGVDTVKRAVRRARESNLFTVFVIVDNPNNRDSILDIRVPVFKGRGQLPEIKSYMDDFPFPFYILLRDINGLPAILSDALRQWFELVASVER